MKELKQDENKLSMTTESELEEDCPEHQPVKEAPPEQVYQEVVKLTTPYGEMLLQSCRHSVAELIGFLAQMLNADEFREVFKLNADKEYKSYCP